MVNKIQFNDLKASLDTVRQINWLDGIQQLPDDVDENLLDQCSDIIQEFREFCSVCVVRFLKILISRGRCVITNQNQKVKNEIEGEEASSVKKERTKNKNHESIPCFRPSGPINCPKNKLPMPRDLWYRIVYSQALEQQLGSGEASTPQSPSKRKRVESTDPRQQQTMNAVISSMSNRMIERDGEKGDCRKVVERNDENLESPNSNPSFPTKSFISYENQLGYITETLPLKIECQNSQFKENDQIKTILSTQSAHVELLNRPKIYRGMSADAKLEHKNELNAEQITSSSIEASPDSPILFDHPLINQLFEYYHLEDIPRHYLFKQLNRRLKHIRQSLKMMSLDDIELKLKYKRDALTKKRQTPVQSLTKDERIAMAELELNVYEYVQALDEPSSKSFHINDEDVLQTEQTLSIPPNQPSYDTVEPVVRSPVTSESSMVPSPSTFNTVQPSAPSESTARLSTVTQFSEPTDKLGLWTHPLESNLMAMFDSYSPSRKSQIHKQLARRYEHICKKAQELSTTQLQTQIDSKSKALELSKRLSHPNKDDLLRIAELELSLFELLHEQIQRNQIDN